MLPRLCSTASFTSSNTLITCLLLLGSDLAAGRSMQSWTSPAICLTRLGGTYVLGFGYLTFNISEYLQNILRSQIRTSPTTVIIRLSSLSIVLRWQLNFTDPHSCSKTVCWLVCILVSGNTLMDADDVWPISWYSSPLSYDQVSLLQSLSAGLMKDYTFYQRFSPLSYNGIVMRHSKTRCW